MKNRAQTAFFEAFIRLMHVKKFEEITATEIIQCSGYSRSSFYSKYTDKFALVEALLRIFAESYAKVITEAMLRLRHTPDFLYHYSVEILEFAYENRELFHLVFTSEVPGAALDDFCRETIAAFHQLGSFSMISNTGYLSEDFFYYAATHQYLIYLKYWDAGNYRDPIEDLAHQILYLQEHLKPFELLK